jgi:hypothetical protein
MVNVRSDIIGTMLFELALVDIPIVTSENQDVPALMA